MNLNIYSSIPFDEASRAEDVAADFALSLGGAAAARHARGGPHAEPLPAVLRSKPSTVDELPALAVTTKQNERRGNKMLEPTKNRRCESTRGEKMLRKFLPR